MVNVHSCPAFDRLFTNFQPKPRLGSLRAADVCFLRPDIFRGGGGGVKSPHYNHEDVVETSVKWSSTKFRYTVIPPKIARLYLGVSFSS